MPSYKHHQKEGEFLGATVHKPKTVSAFHISDWFFLIRS